MIASTSAEAAKMVSRSISKFCREIELPTTSSIERICPTARPPLASLSCLAIRSEEHTSELQSRLHLVCRLLLEKISTAVKARTINNGQSCIAAKRFIVHDEIYVRFEKEFVEAMKRLRVGDPIDESIDVGPLAT